MQVLCFSGWWRPLALAWPGPSNLQSRALGVSRISLWSGWHEPTSSAFCVSSYRISTLPLLILFSGPAQVLPASKASFLMPQPSGHPLFCCLRAHVVPSGGELHPGSVQYGLCSQTSHLAACQEDSQEMPLGGTLEKSERCHGSSYFRAPPMHSA